MTENRRPCRENDFKLINDLVQPCPCIRPGRLEKVALRIPIEAGDSLQNLDLGK